MISKKLTECAKVKNGNKEETENDGYGETESVSDDDIYGSEMESELNLSEVDASRLSCEELSFLDLSFLLFNCESEERAVSRGVRGCYALSDGPLVYAGICAVVPRLRRLAYREVSDDALCLNVRAGDWLFEYFANRLADRPTIPLLQIRDAIRDVGD
eukprot:Selendium_serpulae@DN10079_c0_g1_i1.p1